VVTRGKEKA
jgi:DNA polymerase I-like protein with 3'-5' exonuclease and polymerase domains